jgi:hypothetical protein
MLWLTLLVTVLLLAGLAVLAKFGVQVFGELRHFTRTAADASGRMKASAEALAEAAEPLRDHAQARKDAG